MDVAEAVTAEELWGWPVGVLDHLYALQRAAWAGSVSIDEWREQDAALRVDQPAVSAEEVGETLSTWIGAGELNLREHGALLGRLTMLANPAPTDEQLWAQLESVLARAGRVQGFDLSSVDDEKRDRIAGWLTRPGSGIDEVTGLPWSVVARFRVVDSVPQSVAEARKAALHEATESERERADLLASRRAELDSTSDDWPS